MPHVAKPQQRPQPQQQPAAAPITNSSTNATSRRPNSGAHHIHPPYEYAGVKFGRVENVPQEMVDKIKQSDFN
jgi:hypothetical protein